MPEADKTLLATLIRPCQYEEPFVVIFILFYSSRLPELRDSTDVAGSHCVCPARWDCDVEEELLTPQSAPCKHQGDATQCYKCHRHTSTCCVF